VKLRTYILLSFSVALVLGLAALIALLARGALYQVDRASEEKTSTLARTVVSAIEGVMRHGPDKEGRIYGILEEVARDPEVVSVAIVAQSGSPIVVRGAPLADLPRPAGAIALARNGSRITAVAPLEVKASCTASGAWEWGQGDGHPDWKRDLPPGAYGLALVTDTASARRVRGPILAMAAVGGAVLLALLVAAALLARSIAARGELGRRVALEQQRRQGLESLGLVAAGLAHEIRNPLGAIRGYAQLLGEQAADPVSRERAALMLPELDRVAERLEEFLGFARKRMTSAAPVDLGTLAAQVVALFRPDADAAGVALEAAAAIGSPIVSGDAAELKELLTNLVLNAVQACGRGGRVAVKAERRGAEVALSVVDTGPGIRPEDAAHLFEPYFTTKERGSGLGLAISRRIAEDHGAVLTLENAPGGGSIARLAFSVEADR
jgi:signal transduction histidine kinase